MPKQDVDLTSLQLPPHVKYGFEPDPSPDSVNGWRWIGGQIREDAETRPFWDAVTSGAFGVTHEEIGRSGQKLTEGLQKLLGDVDDEQR